jgi:hypothetical protein
VCEFLVHKGIKLIYFFQGPKYADILGQDVPGDCLLL